MHALQVPHNESKGTGEQNSFIYDIFRKITLKMLTVSNVASYAFGYCMILICIDMEHIDTK